jgi:hypothetical protein
MRKILRKEGLKKTDEESNPQTCPPTKGRWPNQLGTVQALLGHPTSEITRKVYLHAIPEDQRRAVAGVVSLVFGFDRACPWCEGQATYVLRGTSEEKKPGAAKIIFMGQLHSDNAASVQMADRATGAIVFACAVNKNTLHGQQTTAEACAKHLKDQIEKK